MSTGVPLHPLLFAAYPALALLAYNLREVQPGVIWRPLAFSLASCFLSTVYCLLSTLSCV